MNGEGFLRFVSGEWGRGELGRNDGWMDGVEEGVMRVRERFS